MTIGLTETCMNDRQADSLYFNLPPLPPPPETKYYSGAMRGDVCFSDFRTEEAEI